MKPRCRASQGFTLIEILVVLIIVALVSGILMQSLGQIYRLQGRFGLQLAQSQEGSMYADWFRQVVQGLQTDFPQGKDKFSGSETEMAGLSTSPLSSDYGSPTRVSLKISYEAREDVTRLLYAVKGASASDAERPSTALFRWPGRIEAKLVYLDAEGVAHDQWPPVSGTWPQLPSVIMVQAGRGDTLQVLAAVPRGSTEAKQPLVQLGIVQ